MQKLASILERYEYQLRAVAGSLQEIQERLDGARIVWQMQLDSLRNRIIRINLFISLCSFSLMVATVPATWLGMNVVNGWEEQVGMFPSIILGSLAAASTTFVASASWYMFWPNRQVKVRRGVVSANTVCCHHTHRTQNKARELQVLQDLLMYHMDDLDEILVALKDKHGQIQRPDFERLVRRAQTTRIMCACIF